MSEFTDRIRMEIIPELEERLKATIKTIRKSYVFTTDYKAGVKDNLLCAVDILNDMLDESDRVEAELDEAQDVHTPERSEGE